MYVRCAVTYLIDRLADLTDDPKDGYDGFEWGKGRWDKQNGFRM